MNIKDIIEMGLIPSATNNTRSLEQVRNLSSVFNKQFNQIAETVKNINNDTSRTKAEKATLYSKVSKKLDTDLSNTIAVMIDNISSEQATLQAKKETILKSGDKLVNLHLATHLRDNADQASELLSSDLRYLQASSDFPASYFGLDNKILQQMQNSGIRKHVPEIGELEEQINHSEKHAKHLIKYYDSLKTEVTNLTDTQALQNRVDADSI